ncbi:NAD-dependent epimerase/dehydratase family protein, partial [Klebsiella pneumoniae]
MASIQRQIHTAIITGPTGAIGMALCAKLLAEGVTVYAVTHPGSVRAALLPQDARLHVVPCDAAELAALPELIPEKADAFFH